MKIEGKASTQLKKVSAVTPLGSAATSAHHTTHPHMDGDDSTMQSGGEDSPSSIWLPLLISFFAGISTGLGGLVVVCWGVPSVRVVGLMEALAAGVMLYLSAFELFLPSVQMAGWVGCLLSLACGCMICWLMEQIPTPASWQAFVKAEAKGAGNAWCNLHGEEEVLEAGEAVSIMTDSNTQRQLKLVKREKQTAASTELPMLSCGQQGDDIVMMDNNKEKEKDKLKDEELEYEKVEKLEERSIDAESRGRVNLIQVAIVTCLAISLHNFPEGIAVYLTSLRNIDLGLSLAIGITLHNIPGMKILVIVVLLCR